MKTFEVPMDGLSNIHVTEEMFREGIAIKFVGEFPKDMGKHIRIYPEKTYTDDDYEWVQETYYTVPGHPNCEFGDCGHGCHVVSCAIYQGYEEEPNNTKECDARTRRVRRLKEGR